MPEYHRIVNTRAHTIFSESFPTEEAAQGRIDEYKAMGQYTENLAVFIGNPKTEPYRGENP